MRNVYGATRADGSRIDRPRGTWKGWVQYGGVGRITSTPQNFRTRREALAAIKGQHP